MHELIRDRLENLLRNYGANEAEVSSHLASCRECSSELKDMQDQASLFASLRVPDVAEPAAGFYARVLQRIEEREDDSIWSIFVESPFGRRLAIASFTIALLLGGYAVSLERGHAFATPQPAPEMAMHYDALVVGSPSEQRDAVLDNFASHHLTSVQLTSAQGQIQ